MAATDSRPERSSNCPKIPLPAEEGGRRDAAEGCGRRDARATLAFPTACGAGPLPLPKEAGDLPHHQPHPIVGMTKALPPSTEPSGQRCVTVFTLVKNFTPSMPCWLVSPNALRFHPPNV